MKPSWWLEEQGFAGLEHLDEEYVEAYDAKAQIDPGRWWGIGLWWMRTRQSL